MVRQLPAHRVLPVLLALLAACAPARAASEGPTLAPVALLPTDTSVVTVTGTASVRIPSDRARVQVAVETRGTGSAQASDANAQVMSEVIAAVRRVMGDGATVETTGYQLNPVYARSSQGESRISGYTAVNQVVVVLRDPERVAPVLDASLGAGANRITGLSFFASNPEPARLQAVRDATAGARREAEAVAEALGMTLGSPMQVQSSSSRPRGTPDMAMMEARLATPVEAGSESVSATVTITYRLLSGARP